MMNKRPWQIRTLLPLSAAVLLTAVTAGRAQAPAQHIDVSALKTQINDVVVPNPSEVFAALDKMGSMNWRNVQMPVSKASGANQRDIAMVLGVVIANGFVAVEAKDGSGVEEIGRKVIKLAESLGVGEQVKQHSNAIISAAKDDNWSGVRSELDKAKSSVQAGMDKLKSKDESELVSIAGWLRGTQAITALIMADYKPERSELLHQPDLLTTFESQFAAMGKVAREDKKVIELREGLKKVKALIPAGADDPISQKAVEQINAITTDLVKSIAP